MISTNGATWCGLLPLVMGLSCTLLGMDDYSVVDPEAASCDHRLPQDCPPGRTCQCDVQRCWCQAPSEELPCDPANTKPCADGAPCRCDEEQECRCESITEPECQPTLFGSDGCDHGQQCDCTGGRCHCVEELPCNPNARQDCPPDEVCQCADQESTCSCQPWTCVVDGRPEHGECPGEHHCRHPQGDCVSPCPSGHDQDCRNGLSCSFQLTLAGYYCVPRNGT